MTDYVPADSAASPLRAHGQDHVLAGWDRLSPTERQYFVEQLSRIDLARTRASLAEQASHSAAADRPDIAPLPVAPPEATAAETRLGEAALRRGEVAALVVAGGQGSRLGFEKPKGMFPVGPVSGASLFQIHAEKLLALGRRYGKPVPFLVMTSPATDADTRDYFEENRYFGLPRPT